MCFFPFGFEAILFKNFLNWIIFLYIEFCCYPNIFEHLLGASDTCTDHWFTGLIDFIVRDFITRGTENSTEVWASAVAFSPFFHASFCSLAFCVWWWSSYPSVGTGPIPFSPHGRNTEVSKNLLTGQPQVKSLKRYWARPEGHHKWFQLLFLRCCLCCYHPPFAAEPGRRPTHPQSYKEALCSEDVLKAGSL